MNGEAISHLNKAVQLQPDYLKALEKLQELAEKEGDERLMLRTEEYQRDLDVDPELTYELGRKYHKINDYNAAIRCYDKADERGKKTHWVSYWRAKALEESGRENEAILGYRETLKRDKSHKYSIYRLSLLLQKQGNPEAEKWKKELNRLYPEFAREKNL